MTIKERYSSSRRAFLGGAAGLASAMSSGCLHLMGVYDFVRSRKAGETISFASQRDRVRKEEATHIATNRSQLIDALETPESTVWIPEETTIDMTGRDLVSIAKNVTIASNRSLDGASGGMIKTDTQSNYTVFVAEHGNLRVTGVRLKGPRTDNFDPIHYGRSTYDYAVTGFRAQGKSVIVDNCEAFGWTGAAFIPGAKTAQTQGWFHHNSMHHNQMDHLGYPMDLLNGEHLIEWNHFDHNRHSIAGFGYWTNGYEARFNVVGPNAIMHAFDMHNLGENLPGLNAPHLPRVSNGHGGRNQRGGNNGARGSRGRKQENKIPKSHHGGKYINIHHNVFELTSHPAFSVQGIPKQSLRFMYNWCGDPRNEGVVLYPPSANVRVKKNAYGQDKKALSKAREWLLDLKSQLSASSEAVFPTKPAPNGLTKPLSITESPSISNTNETTSSASNSLATQVNPITGTALTPVGGDR